MSVPVTIPLGTIQQFSVLANSGVTGSGGAGTVVTGNVGSDPTPAVVNFPPSTVTPPFILYTAADPATAQARADAITAYNYLVAQGAGTVIAAQLDTVTLTSLTVGEAEIFSSATGAFDLAATGTLTLDGPGIFIFQIDSSLTMNVDSNVVGTADPCNIYWRIGTSGTLNGITTRGNFFADASITVGDGSDVTGRTIAGVGATGSVTMAGAGGNTIGGCATIYRVQVDYTPQWPGNHRICYGQTSPNTDTQCCMIDTTASTIGVPKSFTFTVAGTSPCDPGTVSPVQEPPLVCNEYVGYVQPICVSEGSPDFRTPWSVQFCPPV